MRQTTSKLNSRKMEKICYELTKMAIAIATDSSGAEKESNVLIVYSMNHSSNQNTSKMLPLDENHWIKLSEILRFFCLLGFHFYNMLLFVRFVAVTIINRKRRGIKWIRRKRKKIIVIR